MKVFLDTNVVIDFICKREPFFTDAKNIFVMHERGEIECCVSALTIINCAYIMRKVFDKNEVLRVVGLLCKRFDVSAINKSIIIDAVKKQTYDFEDTVQYLSALPYRPEVILTRDKKGFADLGILVMTPAEFVARSRM